MGSGQHTDIPGSSAVDCVLRQIDLLDVELRQFLRVQQGVLVQGGVVGPVRQ